MKMNIDPRTKEKLMEEYSSMSIVNIEGETGSLTYSVSNYNSWNGDRFNTYRIKKNQEGHITCDCPHYEKRLSVRNQGKEADSAYVCKHGGYVIMRMTEIIRKKGKN